MNFLSSISSGPRRGAVTSLRILLAASFVAWAGACSSRAKAGPNADFVPVLVYHHIDVDSTMPLGVTEMRVDTFEDQMRYLAANGYHTATVSELVKYMRGEQTLPPRTVVLTFDDGWRSILNATPILENLGFKATFLIVTGPVDGEYADYVSWDDLKRLAKNPNFEFGAHSVTHPWEVGNNLLTWDKGENPGRGPVDVVYEIQVPRQELSRELGRPIKVWAWPSGWFDDDLIKLAEKSGYDGLLTMRQVTNHPGDDPEKIGRYPVYGQFSLEQFQKLLDGDIEDTAGELLAGGDTLVAQGADAHY